jgi:hypothetical protein
MARPADCAASATIADFGAIILLSLFFSGEGGTGSTLLLLGSLFALGAVVLAVVRGVEHSMRIRADLLGDRVRVLQPGLLRRERRPLRPRRADRLGVQPFIVASTAIGLELGLIDAAGAAALVGAGLLSVLLFPLVSITALRRTCFAVR